MAIFKTTYRVTWSDIDAARVVHHSNYFKFFERAEEEFYQHLGLDLNYFIEHEIWLPRVEVRCNYIFPSKFGDTLEIMLAIDKIEDKTIRYDFTIRKKDTEKLIARGYVVAVAVHKTFREAIKIPPEIARRLVKFKNS